MCDEDMGAQRRKSRLRLERGLGDARQKRLMEITREVGKSLAVGTRLTLQVQDEKCGQS